MKHFLLLLFFSVALSLGNSFANEIHDPNIETEVAPSIELLAQNTSPSKKVDKLNQVEKTDAKQEAKAAEENTARDPIIPDKKNFPWLPFVAGLLLAVYEVLIRYIPTLSSYSILNVISSILNIFVKDKASGGGLFKVTKVES